MDKIAVLGPEGTFSDDAARRFLKQNGMEAKLKPVYYPTIDEAFHMIGKECGWGIIPVENTLDGYVQRTLDLLLEMDVSVVGEITIPVQFSFIANTHSLKEVRKLYVQFKASGQCRRFIDSLEQIEVMTTQSNMESYYHAERGRFGEGAVIPAHMLSASSASCKVENVTDAQNNNTRFLVIRAGKQAEPSLSGKIRVLLYVMPETDSPGLLYGILKDFYEHQVNLASIMSRPTRKDMGTYNFYLELSGDARQKVQILAAIESVAQKHPVKWLGIYSM